MNSSSALPVSVTIPAYNSAATIARALRSVAAQPPGFQPAEIIVVDDCSTDDTGVIAERLGATVIRHEANHGAATARNTAIAAATQPWLALLDADDEWLPNRLSALWPHRGTHVLLSGACVSVFADDPGRPLAYAGTPTRQPYLLRFPDQLIPQNLVMASATLVRRDAVLAAGGYDTSLKYAEDWDLWLRVLERGTGLLVPEVISIYHRHGAQKSGHETGPTDAHRRIVRGCERRGACSPQTVDRWEGVQRWLALRARLRARDWRGAGRLATRIAGHPADIRTIATRRLRYEAWRRHGRQLDAAVRSGAAGELRDRLALLRNP